MGIFLAVDLVGFLFWFGFFSVVFFGFGPFLWGEINEHIERNL